MIHRKDAEVAKGYFFSGICDINKKYYSLRPLRLERLVGAKLKAKTKAGGEQIEDRLSFVGWIEERNPTS